ncbi:21213_t:CDS:2, partial [Gigaspora margarita]
MNSKISESSVADNGDDDDLQYINIKDENLPLLCDCVGGWQYEMSNHHQTNNTSRYTQWSDAGI